MREPTQPSSDLRAQLSAFAKLGFDVDRLLAASGVTRAELDDPEARFPYAVLRAMIREVAADRRTDHLGLRLAANVPFGAYDAVDYLVFACDSVRDGLSRLARYFRNVTQSVSLRLVETDGEVRFEVRDELGDAAAFRFNSEYTVTITLRRLREGTGSRFTAQYASFRHATDQLHELEGVVGCRLRFQQAWNGFAMTKVAASLPFERRDPVLRRVLEEHAQALAERVPALEEDGVGDVRRVLAEELAGGDARIARIAHRLGFSPRTLQRRLHAAGESYQSLLDDARHSLARTYLEVSSLATSEIAHLLGYSEPSAFHRAFRRWTGETPSTWRSKRGSLDRSRRVPPAPGGRT